METNKKEYENPNLDKYKNLDIEEYNNPYTPPENTQNLTNDQKLEYIKSLIQQADEAIMNDPDVLNKSDGSNQR